MFVRRIELHPEIAIEIAAADNLVVQGMEGAILVVESAEEEHAEIIEAAGKVTVRLSDDARVQVGPAALTISQVADDLKVRRVHGPLTVGHVGGDLTLSAVGDVQVGNVKGNVVVNRAGAVRLTGSAGDDVSLRHVGPVELATVVGDLHIHHAAALTLERVEDDLSASGVAGPVRLAVVQGDASLRHIDGGVSIGRVQGDLDIRDVGGDLEVANVQGDITLHVAFQPGRRYSLAGQRDISVHLPEGTAARFLIRAPHWTGPEGAYTVESEQEGRVVLCVGEGGPQVHLAADGKVNLGITAEDWERSFRDFGQQMEAWGLQFGRQMEAWGEQVRQQVEHADWEKVGQEIAEATARVTRLVEARLQEIDLEEMGQRARMAANQAGDHVREVDWERIGRKIEEATRQGMQRVQAGLQRLRERLPQEGPPFPPVPPAAAADPVTDEERMAVLRMVEEGRLTSDEASALLDALDSLDA